MKKTLSLLLTFVMVFALATPVFAAITPGYIIGDATMTDLPWPAYVLAGSAPTGTTMNFAIDPFGHLDLAAGAVVDPEDRNDRVVVGDGSPSASLYRASITGSMDAVITANFRLTNTAADGPPVNVNVVNTVAAVTADDENNVLIWAQPSAEPMATAAAPFVGSARVFPILVSNAAGTGGGINLTYLLRGLPSEVFAYTVSAGVPTALARRPVDVTSVNDIAVNIGGIFNPDANWAAAGMELRLMASVVPVALYEGATYPAGDDAFLAHDAVQVAHGLLAGGAHTENLTGPTSGVVSVAPAHIEALTPPVPAVGFSASAANVTNATWTPIPFVFPAGASVASVTANGVTTTMNTHWRANTALREQNIIEFNFGIGTPTRNVVVTLTGDHGTSSIVLTVVPSS